MTKRIALIVSVALLTLASCAHRGTPVLTDAHRQRIAMGMSYRQVVKILGFEGTEKTDNSFTNTAYYTWDMGGQELSVLFISDAAFGCLSSREELKKKYFPQIEKKSYAETVKVIGKEGTPGVIKDYYWQGAENTYAKAWFVNDRLIMIDVGQNLVNVPSGNK